MSEVKKLIISRKKTDQNGNEYALIKISSNQQKRPEIRVIKFKKSPKKSNPKKKNNEENSSTKAGKNNSKAKNSSNIDLLQKNLKPKIIDSPTTKSSKFTSFISTFNTPSKSKHSFIYRSPKTSYIYSINQNNFKTNIHPNINNYLYSPNLSKNNSILRNNSDIFKTEYTYSCDNPHKEIIKTKENLNNKIIILSQQNKQYLARINNIKLKESKLNNIKVKKLKDKEEIIKAKNKKKEETEFKKQLLDEIKEINKHKKTAVQEINKKEKKLMKNNIKKENNKMKKMINKNKKENYQKKRENYLKIKREEEERKNKKLRYNLSGVKKLDNHFSFTKTVYEDDNKEIEQLKKKYEILKIINNEYNEYLKEFQFKNNHNLFQRTFTPQELMMAKKSFSYSIVEPGTKNNCSNGNTPRKKEFRHRNKKTHKNNSVSNF
jgi:hypothetical protein